MEFLNALPRLLMIAGGPLAGLLGLLAAYCAMREKSPKQRRNLIVLSVSAFYSAVLVGMAAAGIVNGWLLWVFLLPQLLPFLYISGRLQRR